MAEGQIVESMVDNDNRLLRFLRKSSLFEKKDAIILIIACS
jgi:hypothetical protein